jgi:hypothetical protein
MKESTYKRPARSTRIVTLWYFGFLSLPELLV